MEHSNPNTTGVTDWSILHDALSVLDLAAAVVTENDEVLVCNSAWAKLGEEPIVTAPPRAPAAGDHEVTSAAESRIQTGDENEDDGAPEVPLPPRRMTTLSSATEVAHHYGYDLERRTLQSSGWGKVLSMVIMRAPTSQLVDADEGQRFSDHLLIHQTLIQEDERRRVGLALHDVVSQDLVYVRSRLLGLDLQPKDTEELIGTIDHIIDEVRTLTFDLSPPILEDLGLRAALQWLTEHIGQRYSAYIAMTDNEVTPTLGERKTVILFRAARELLINAAKHAPGAEIIMTLIVGKRLLRIMIKDTGPGFHLETIRAQMREGRNYGLLSIEQQVRGLGGQLHLTSAPGEGTKAIITMPMDHESDPAAEDDHA